MQITQEQFGKIAGYLPKQRGNVSMTNLQLLNAILYVCRGKRLQVEGIAEIIWEFGYNISRLNRWSKDKVLNRVFAALQIEEIILINVEVVFLDSTSVKVYPDGCGA